MALTNDQRIAAIRELLALDDTPFNHSKADLHAALDAADSWVASNAASFNTALPQPFRGAATAGQKAALLAFVCLRRAGK